jgi:cytoskeletal protein RodZ
MFQRHWRLFYGEAVRAWPQITSEGAERGESPTQVDTLAERPPHSAEQAPSGPVPFVTEDAVRTDKGARPNSAEQAQGGSGPKATEDTAQADEVANISQLMDVSSNAVGTAEQSAAASAEPDTAMEVADTPTGESAEAGPAASVADASEASSMNIDGKQLPDPASGTYVVDGTNIMLEKIITRDEFLSCAEGGSVQSPLTLRAMLLKVREYMGVQDDEGTFAAPVSLLYFLVCKEFVV